MIKLTQAEKLTLWRRRKGLTQGLLAIRWGTTQSDVSEMERGYVDVPKRFQRSVKNVTKAEECFILRRRLGLSTRDVMKKFQVSLPTVARMEDPDRNAPMRDDYHDWLSEGQK